MLPLKTVTRRLTGLIFGMKELTVEEKLNRLSIHAECKRMRSDPTKTLNSMRNYQFYAEKMIPRGDI